MHGFAVFASGWGLAMLAVFITAIRLSYRIEARSPDLKNRTGIPRNAMIFHTMFNQRVAGDSQTQALRRRMNTLLLVNLLGFVAFGAYLALWGAPV